MWSSATVTASVGPWMVSTPTVAEDHALGGLNEDVAGAKNLVDGGDRLGAVSEGGYGLRAANGEDSIDVGDGRGSKDDRSYGTIGAGGSYQNDLPDACDSGGNGSHKDGGRINGGAAGNVEADPVQGGNSLSKAVACEIPDGVLGQVRSGSPRCGGRRISGSRRPQWGIWSRAVLRSL